MNEWAEVRPIFPEVAIGWLRRTVSPAFTSTLSGWIWKYQLKPPAWRMRTALPQF